VRILEYDVVDSIPFLIMEYAPNGTLRQYHPKGTVLPPGTIIPYVRQVAAALQYAHGRKLIHRDVKPENMLLGYKNEVLLSDFGLAVIVQSSRDRLQTVAGTETYMAPEQLQGKACPASDQYALATVVYEWLSGERLFSGSFIEVATQHVLVPPPSLRNKLPTFPLAIDQVLQKALAKSPDQRFASVLEFARAFEQVCHTEASKQYASAPVHLGKLFTTYRKHSAAVLKIAWSPDGKWIASASNDSTVQVWAADSMRKVSYTRHSDKVTALAWSPIRLKSSTEQGYFIASASADSTVQIWDATTGRRKFIYRNHVHPIHAVAWSPDGQYIASAGEDKTIQVWRMPKKDTPTEKILLISQNSFNTILTLAWSPDGKYIASGGVDQVVEIWAPSTGSTICTYHKHQFTVSAVAWSPDGTRVASASFDRTVQLWDAATGENAVTYPGHSSWVYAVAWARSGPYIASASSDKTVQVWLAE